MKTYLLAILSFLCYFASGQVDVSTDHSLYEQFDSLSNSDLLELIKNSSRDSVEFVPTLVGIYLGRPEAIGLDSSQIIKAKQYMGRAYRRVGSYALGISVFKEVYSYSKLHKDSFSQAESADQIATMNTFMGNMHEAQGYLLEAVEIYQRVGSAKDIASVNNGLAIFYYDIGHIDKAIETYKLSLEQYEAIDDTLGRANIHANLGMVFMDEGRYAEAEHHLLQQGYLDTLLKTQWGLGFHHDFMGTLRKRQKKYDEALQYYKQALSIRSKLSSHYNLAETRGGLASIYNKLGRHDEAIEQATAILEHRDLHQSLSQASYAFDELSEAHELKGNYIKALAYHKRYKNVTDSIYNRDLLEEITLKDALYEKEKQDHKIDALHLQNEISLNKIQHKNKVIILCAIGILIILSLLYKLYSLYQQVVIKRQEITLALDEKDLLLREIHHRVKNNLQLVSSLLTLQGRSIDDANVLQAINEGKSRVRSMALIHQDLYNRDDITGLGVQGYLKKLTKELFDTYKIDTQRITLSMDIQDIALDVDTMIPLGLIINELITNSLKYAFPDDRKGTLNVSLRESTQRLMLTVWDDGVGYDQNHLSADSFGSTLVSALTNQLNGELNRNSDYGTHLTFSFKDYKKT